MKSAVLLSLVLFTLNAGATVTVDRPDCPSQFEGKVKEVMEELGPSHPLSTQKVIFQNQATIKGNVGETITLDVLKHGPFQIEPGQDYLVQMRSGKLCWIEKL